MAKSLSRSWSHRFVIVLCFVSALAAFATAGVLAFGQWAVSQRQLVSIATPDVALPNGAANVVVTADGDAAGATQVSVAVPTNLAEPDAANFLLVGADNGECATKSGTDVDDRRSIGERSDTIMVWRVNPANKQVAVLSLPRDLYVNVPGGRKSRINATWKRNDPSRLIATISDNFKIPIDHYVQVDLCAFKRLVDGIGGVEIPFEAHATDHHTGFAVFETGCVTLDAEQALAYVRSRKMQFEDENGNWVADKTSDLGRTARQQDFIRRVIDKAIKQGLYRPEIAASLIEANRNDVVTDTGLPVKRILEFASVLQSIDVGNIRSYRIDTRAGLTADKQQILHPLTQGENMQAILAVFRGEATLADAPDQVLSTTTTIAPDDETADTTTTAVRDGTTTTTVVSEATETSVDDESDTGDDTSATTLPTVQAEENTTGVSPDRSVSCP